MNEPRANNGSEIRENQKRTNGVDIHESIETLIPFTDSIKAKIHEFRTQFKETYKQYLNFIENPQSRIQQSSRNEFGSKVQYPSFHKVGKIYDSTMKSLGDFITTFTEDSRNLYSIAIKISSLQQEFDNLVARYYNRTDDLDVNQLYQINKKIDNIIENHNKLVITYNAEIEHFNALRHNLSNGILVYESTTGKSFVLSRDDDLEEFRRLVEIDEVLQKRSSIYATFASRFKDDLQHSADSTVLMPVRPLKKDNWILQSPVEQNNDASDQTQEHAQYSEDPGPFNQEYQPSQQNTEFDAGPEHHMDTSVPNVELSSDVQQTYQEPMVTSPPTSSTRSNYELPLQRIHQHQHHEEPTSSKPKDTPLEQMSSSSPSILKDFQHSRKETTSMNYFADKNHDDSQKPYPHTQNYNEPEPSHQVHQPPQQSTEVDESTQLYWDQQPRPDTQNYNKPEPSHQVPQSPQQNTEFDESTQLYWDQQPRPDTQNYNKPEPSHQEHQPSQQNTKFDEATESYQDHPGRYVKHITNVQQTSPVSMVSKRPASKTGNRISKPAKPRAPKSQAVLNLVNNPELSISLVQPTRAPVPRRKRYQNLRRSTQLPTPASPSVTQPISSTALLSKTSGGATNPLPSENLETQPIASVNRDSAYPTIKDILARRDISLVPVSRTLPNQDDDAPSISRKIPSPFDRSAKSHSDIEAAKSPQPTPVRNLDVNQSNVNQSPPIDQNISLDHDQQSLPQSENSEPTDPEPRNKKSKLQSESELSPDELSNQSMDIDQLSREPLIITENSNSKVQQSNNEPNQKEESELSEQIVDLTEDSDEDIITIQESKNIDKSNDSQETDTVKEETLRESFKNILAKDVITKPEIDHLKRFLPIFKEILSQDSHKLREIESNLDDKVIMKELGGSNHEALEVEIQELEKRSSELRYKIKDIGKIVFDITEKINESEVKEESKSSEQVVDLTEDSDEDLTAAQESADVDESNDSRKTDTTEDYDSSQKLRNILAKDEITESDVDFLKTVLQKIEGLQNRFSNRLDEVQRNYDKIAVKENQSSDYKDLEIKIQELEEKRQKLEKEMKINAKISAKITEKINESEVNEESNDNQGQAFEEISGKNVTVMSPPNSVSNQIESDPVIELNTQSDEQTTKSSDPEQNHQDITAQPEVVAESPTKRRRQLSSEEAATKISKSDQSKPSDGQFSSAKLQMETRASKKGESKFSADNTSEESSSGSNKSEKQSETIRHQLTKWLKTEKNIKLLIQQLAAEAKKGNANVSPRKDVKELLWANENFVPFLKKHIYLLSIKETKVKTIKSLCEKMFTEVINHETKMKKDLINRLRSPLTMELNETNYPKKRKEAQLKYLQNKLKISEISYYYYNDMRNQIYNDVVKFELGPGKITNDEKWRLIDALRRMNKDAVALKLVGFKTEKENINKMRKKIKILKKELKLLEDERNFRINNLRNEVIDIDDNINGKISKIVELKTEISKSSIAVEQDKELELKKCETELKYLQRAHKMALKKYMTSD